MSKCYQAKLCARKDTRMTRAHLFSSRAKMIVGQDSKKRAVRHRLQTDYSQVVFNQALGWRLTQEVNTGCKVWCYVMSQKWTCGRDDRPSHPSLPPSDLPLPASFPPTLNITPRLHAWPDESWVCLCMLSIHAVYTCIHIHTSPLRPPILMPGQTMSKWLSSNPLLAGREGGGSVHADKCVCECVLGGGLGDVGKTLWQTKVFTSHPDRPTGI